MASEFYREDEQKKIILVKLEKTDLSRFPPEFTQGYYIDLTVPDTRQEQYKCLLLDLGCHGSIPNCPILTLSKSFDLVRCGRVLAIGAHWDDILLGCFGTLLKLKRFFHYEVNVVVLCTGYNGYYYGKEQKDLPGRIKGIYNGLFPEPEGFICNIVDPQKYTIPDRGFAQSQSAVNLCIHDLANDGKDFNLILAPPLDDYHEDHAITGKLVMSHFRKPSSGYPGV